MVSRRVPRSDWIAREHSGERLVDIAAEERLDPAVVRQRVSRFRKLLRARWLLAAAALGIAVGLARAGSSPIAAYWQDERAATALDTSRSFRVIQVDAPPGVDGAKAELFEAEARLSAITLRGRSLTIVTPVRKLTGRIEMIDEQHGQLRLEDGRSFSIQVRDEGARILVRYGGGTVVLESTTR